MWGGGLEGDEIPEEALVREIKEELDINVSEYTFLNIFESEFATVSAFYTKVDEDFENTITVLEGQYGKFFTMSEIQNLENMTNDVKEIISHLHNKGSST